MTSAQALHLAAWLVGSVAFWGLAIFGTQRLLRQDWLSLGEFLFLVLSLVTFSTGVARTFTTWSWLQCVAAGVVLGPLAWCVFGMAFVGVLSVGEWLVEQWRVRRQDDD